MRTMVWISLRNCLGFSSTGVFAMCRTCRTFVLDWPKGAVPSHDTIT